MLISLVIFASMLNLHIFSAGCGRVFRFDCIIVHNRAIVTYARLFSYAKVREYSVNYVRVRCLACDFA